MTVIRPGCVYCGMFHDPKTCNYQLVLLIEAYIQNNVNIDAGVLAEEITKRGYIRANV